ncbi:unnamed protein product [Chondrus crispus]|uniref:ATP-dependent RNA helicase n=1 Tax=Chondrus crispus TaxID=2769 RepID=R7QP73_CHOCR|nr:unnamed protein product [Chondrus crispus]CDF39563.1 unnamed protein product [Chondrus crispus]|eukprot:XP_005709857.1 unnamed protein product [Chondrus crispus]
MTAARFDALPVAPPLRRAMAEVFKYDTMTHVQSAAVPVALEGADLLVKARTGTGKTLAFLLPTLHAVAQSPPKNGTAVLVISPTRELAQQIAEEARMLLSYLPRFTLQVLVGGTNIRSDLAAVRRSGPPTLLVATPGRLLDHLGNPSSGFPAAMHTLSALILDEADRLLDMGFAPDLKRIFHAIPSVQHRQTLLFSATMPADVENMARMALKPDFKVVDCVGEGENTHHHVKQSMLVTSLPDQMPALAAVLAEHTKLKDYKIIVFFTTARQTQFSSELFAMANTPVLEIHSRKSQGHRTKVSDKFRNGKSLIMFTSDVTARGLDYPDVSAVIQVGLPADKSQYVHRIGRTARAGKDGSGVLLLADFEAQSFMRKATDLPIQRIDSLPDTVMRPMRATMASSVGKVPYGTKAGAYQAWLGFYNSNLKNLHWKKEDLVAMANQWAMNVAALSEPPALLARTVGKMGLRDVQGLRVEGRNGVPRSERSVSGTGAGGGRGGRGGRGRASGSEGGRWRGGPQRDSFKPPRY